MSNDPKQEDSHDQNGLDLNEKKEIENLILKSDLSPKKVINVENSGLPGVTSTPRKEENYVENLHRRKSLECDENKVNEELSQSKKNESEVSKVQESPKKTETDLKDHMEKEEDKQQQQQKDSNILSLIFFYLKEAFTSNRYNRTKDSTDVFKNDKFETKNILLFGLIIIPILFLTQQLIKTNGTNPIVPTNDSQNHIISAKTLSERLKLNFPNQTKNFYSNILSCYEHSILKNRDPSIIILVSDKLTNQNVNCVAKNLLKFLIDENKSSETSKINYDLLNIDAKNYLNKESNFVKKDLDDNLVDIFTKLNKKIALINDIQLIPAKAMLLFYTYGDDELTAKFKGILILLTYELNTPISNNKAKYIELSKNYAKLSEFVEKNINDIWSINIDYDQLQPLYTRIANNIVLVNHEKNCE